MTTVVVAKMDEQRRLEIERPILESALGVRLTAGQTQQLWALVGARRQLQLLAPNNSLAKLRDRLEAGSLEEHLAWDAASDEHTDLVRKIYGLVEVSCASEPKRSKLRLTVHAEAERLGLIESAADVVLFASGEILELWRPEAWVEYSAISNLREFESQLRTAFGEIS